MSQRSSNHWRSKQEIQMRMEGQAMMTTTRMTLKLSREAWRWTAAKLVDFCTSMVVFKLCGEAPSLLAGFHQPD